jgi:poly(3-hydroxybutyrate) depolymerase
MLYRHPAQGTLIISEFLLNCVIALSLLLFATNPSILAAQRSHSTPSPLSSGCNKSTPPTGLLTLSAKDGNGTARKYLLQVPADYDPHKTYSLVFAFHGWGGTAEGTRASGLQNAPGAASSALFVFPQGIQIGKDGVGWDDGAQGHDMPFFDNMLAAVESSYCIVKEEVFAAGFSWGGDFTTDLACDRGEILRAVAVNSATDDYKDSADYRTYVNYPCPGDRHPAVRFEHAVDADSAYPAPNFATTSHLFQALNHCESASDPSPSSSPQISCRKFQGCSSTYIECPFDKTIGHTIPPNWPQDTWAFFASFRKPDRDSSHYR